MSITERARTIGGKQHKNTIQKITAIFNISYHIINGNSNDSSNNNDNNNNMEACL
jgi:hypothetical protein